MHISRIMALAITGAVASIIIPVATYLTTRFSPPLNAREQAVLAFTPTQTALIPKTWRTVEITCPVSALPGNSTIASSSPLGNTLSVRSAPAATARSTISFILQGATGNMAIIDGIVVKEGSSFKGGRVTRIEQNRIQLEGKKGKKWLLMD